MAVTSNWEWESISRGIDTNVFAGIVRTRNNWSLTRKRVSDEAYASELGDTATSLDGFNGGVTETIVSPSINALSFGNIVGGDFPATVTVSGAGRSASNGVYSYVGLDAFSQPKWMKGSDLIRWNYSGSTSNDFWEIDSTYNTTPTGTGDGHMPWDDDLTWVDIYGGMYNPVPSSIVPNDVSASWASAGDVWLETGYKRGGHPVYILQGKNHPVEYKRNVCWLSTSGATVAWCMSAFAQDEIENNSFEDNYANLSDDYAIGSLTGYSSIDGIVLEGYSGGIYNGFDATASLGSTQIPLLCTADNQSYPSKSVDWFTQTQNWTYVDSWV